MVDKLKSITTDSNIGAPMRLKDLGDGSFAYAVSATIEGSGGSGVDREVVVTPYRVKTAFTGASVGDTVTSIRVIDVTATPTAVGDTLWYNETTQATFATAPSTANLEPLGATGLTNAQMTSLMATLYAATGAPADAAATTDTGTFSIIALVKRGLTNWTTLLGRLHASLGQKLSAASIPVVLASDQSSVNVALTSAATVVTVAGSVAGGAADAGNPIKVGAKYSATLPSYADGQRADVQTIVDGSLRAAVIGYGAAGTDAIVNGQMVGMYANQGQAPGAMRPLTVSNMVFNGTTHDRMRGDVNGLWTQGNVASGVADAGSPVKVGAKYNLNLPLLADGQRGDLQVGTRGSLSVQLMASNNTSAIAATNNGSDGQAVSFTSIVTSSFPMVYNLDTNQWDRARGSAATGALVNTLAQPGVARQLAAAAAGGSSASIALTTTARRVSIVARGSDLRYLVGTGAVTALATSHYIMAGERIDIGVPASGVIAVLSATAATGVLEITELL